MTTYTPSYHAVMHMLIHRVWFGVSSRRLIARVLRELRATLGRDRARREYQRMVSVNPLAFISPRQHKSWHGS